MNVFVFVPFFSAQMLPEGVTEGEVGLSVHFGTLPVQLSDSNA